ncbi:MAG TPA: hypothetical protein VEQ10_06485 [Vicinamibacteria bacterium]|nr:hypothetical protein [Vicinamibacteria bacterium]
MRRTILLLALLFAAFVDCSAEGFWQSCSPVGTWYGGQESPAKYLLTIAPIRPGHYGVRYDQGFTPAIPKLSGWSGNLIRVGKGSYVNHAIALANTSAAPPTAGGINPQVWAIRAHLRFVDCDTLESEIDFFGVYSWGATPFVDTPDGSRLPPSGVIEETYRRVTGGCPVCPAEPEE